MDYFKILCILTKMNIFSVDFTISVVFSYSLQPKSKLAMAASSWLTELQLSPPVRFSHIQHKMLGGKR